MVHQRGRLLVDACLLDCNAEGLDHLFAPLVTLAHSRSAVPAGGPPPPACLEPACLAPAAPLPPPPPAQAPQVDALLGSPRDDAQAGALIVLGSKIKVRYPRSRLPAQAFPCSPSVVSSSSLLGQHVLASLALPPPHGSCCFVGRSHPGFYTACALCGAWQPT